MIKIGNLASNISVYTCQPKTRDELIKLVEERIDKEGPNCDLNDIDTSEITNMSGIFANSKFNGDISNWNTSNVKYMSCMFESAYFNGDISNWNVSNVKDISFMFYNSEFNQDISKWKIEKNCTTLDVFHGCSIKEEHKPKFN